jgi:hypothetical protein
MLRGAYALKPRDCEMLDLVDRLAETYARSLVPVTRVIHERDIAIRSKCRVQGNNVVDRLGTLPQFATKD